MRIKLYSPWISYGDYAKRYFMVVVKCAEDWLVWQTGWISDKGDTELHMYIYRASCRSNLKYREKPWGKVFTFGEYEEYLTYCTLNETTKEGWPNPSWAVECELLPED